MLQELRYFLSALVRFVLGPLPWQTQLASVALSDSTLLGHVIAVSFGMH